MMNGHICVALCLVLALAPHLGLPHGRMIEPPARNTMWRVGFNTHANYEDSELFCGGIVTQWRLNQGKCGICGDAYSAHRPRPYETGGKYVKNITTRVYAPSSQIEVVIDLVANHLGTFEFSLCPRDSPSQIETEECFIPLKVNNSEKYVLKTHRKGTFVIPVQLPKEVTCRHCIIRWHWKSANNWGTCENGREAVGCGPQETYRNCADVAISRDMGIRGPIFYQYRQHKWHSNLVLEPHAKHSKEDAPDDYYPTFHKL